MSLASFSSLPVKIVRGGMTITIERSRVRVEYRGWRSLLRRDWELPISEFEAVEVSGKTYYVEPDFGASDDSPGGFLLWSSESMVRIEVTLLHPSPWRNVPLAAWEGDTRSYTGWELEPLLKLCTDAARALSLPAVDAGVPKPDV